MNQFDRVTATLKPRRVDDLKHGVDAWIDRELIWEAMWEIEDGEYAGYWAMSPIIDDLIERPPFAWVPFCDLSIAVDNSDKVS